MVIKKEILLGYDIVKDEKIIPQGAVFGDNRALCGVVLSTCEKTSRINTITLHLRHKGENPIVNFYG